MPSDGRLHIIADKRFHCTDLMNEAVHWHALPACIGDISTTIKQLPVQASVIWVVPECRAARGLLTEVVIAGRIVALVFADTAAVFSAQITGWQKVEASTSAAPLRAVLAQWDADYLPLGRLWIRRLRQQRNGHVGNWMADKVGAARLSRRFARGARLCVYFGHGHNDGMSAYHGLYYDDLLEQQDFSAVETFLSFSCQQLAQPYNRPCFGRELVRSGRVLAFWGAVDHVSTQANNTLARLGIDILLRADVSCVADWIRYMDVAIRAERSKALTTAWRSYRLIGNPQARL